MGAQLRALTPDGVNVVFHLAGDPGDLASLLAPSGRIVSTLGYGAEQSSAAVAVMANPDAAALGRLAGDVVAGQLRVRIERTFPLAEASDAFRTFAAGTLGKLAISVA